MDTPELPSMNEMCLAQIEAFELEHGIRRNWATIIRRRNDREAIDRAAAATRNGSQRGMSR